MITEGILNALLQILTSIFSLLPNIEIEFSGFNDVIVSLSVFFQYVFYFFPMDTVAYCFSVLISIQLFKIVIAFIKTIWELLPIA